MISSDDDEGSFLQQQKRKSSSSESSHDGVIVFPDSYPVAMNTRSSSRTPGLKYRVRAVGKLWFILFPCY